MLLFLGPTAERENQIFLVLFRENSVFKKGTYNRKISLTIITSLSQVELFVNNQL